MTNAPFMLGISGLRGIAGESLTPDLVTRYAAAFAAVMQEDLLERFAGAEVAPLIAVARDGRAGGEAYHHAAIAGLIGAGARVVDLGVASTPAAAAFVAEQAHAGLMIPASHNPAEWNGVKCFVNEHLSVEDEEGEYDESLARAPAPEHARRVITRFEQGPAWGGPIGREQGPLVATVTDASDRHASRALMAVMNALGQHGEALAAQAANQAGNPAAAPAIHAVLDAVNASGARGGLALLREVCRVTPLFCDDSGVFPHHPEPTAENLAQPGGLCNAVPGLGAQVGFAQDPDADRLAIIDENGTYIGEEYTLVLAAMAVLGWMPDGGFVHPEDGTPRVIAANLSTSRMIDDIAKAAGVRVIRTAVGETNVVDGLLAAGEDGLIPLLGGEGNGGVIWPAVSLVRDSVAAMAMVLALIASTGMKVSELVEAANDLCGGGYAMIKQKSPLAAKDDANPTLERIAAAYQNKPGTTVDTQDGVRIDLDDTAGGPAWVHVRASNTEPILRVITEARTESAARELAQAVLKTDAAATT